MQAFCKVFSFLYYCFNISKNTFGSASRALCAAELRWLAIGYWRLAIGYWLWDMGYWVWAIGRLIALSPYSLIAHIP